MKRLKKRKWEARVLKYIRLIKILDSSAIKAILTQFHDNKTCLRCVLVMESKSIFFILDCSKCIKATNDSEKKIPFILCSLFIINLNENVENYKSWAFLHDFLSKERWTMTKTEASLFEN